MRGHHQYISGHTVSVTQQEANAEEMFHRMNAIHWYGSKTKLKKKYKSTGFFLNWHRIVLSNTGFSSQRPSVINLSLQNIVL